MQIVINVDNELYEYFSKRRTMHDNGYFSHVGKLIKALRDGVSLLKGHGRLIDADELTKEIKGYISDTSNLHYDDLEEAEAFNSAYYNCLDEIEDASTIMEADKEE